jgi:hypothetical protein
MSDHGIMRVGFLLAVVLMTGCARETLFKSNFDPTPINQPPAHVQDVGTANVDGPPGSVIVVAPPVTPSGKWVEIRRPDAQSPVAGLQGGFSKFAGDGEYTFSATLFIPAGSGVATIQFEPFGQPVGTLTNFLHIDFMPDNRVRINDNAATDFGVFPRNQPFILQVTLKIAAMGATAHVVLSGAGASGAKDHTIASAFLPMARQFGAIRIWMGFPWTGAFDATNIVVTRKTD